MALLGRTRLVADPSPLVPVAIVDPDPVLCRELAESIGASSQQADFDHLELGDGPMVLVVGPSLVDERGLARISSILAGRPQVAVVAMADRLDTGLLRAALRAGVSDVIPLDALNELGPAVARISGALEGALVPAPNGLEPVAGGTRGHLTSVISAKGGVGKSVLATNLGVLLAQELEGPVALVDADVRFGDVAVMLRMSPRHTSADAVSHGPGLDTAVLHQHLARHEPSGLLVLPAPTDPAVGDQIEFPQLLELIDLLRSTCRHVVVDAPGALDELTLGLIEASDDALFVAGLDIPSIKNAKLVLQTLRLLEVSTAHLHLVLNRTDRKINVDLGEVERALGMKVEASVPADVAVGRAVNKGMPVVLESPRSDAAKALERLARTLRRVEAKA